MPKITRKLGDKEIQVSDIDFNKLHTFIVKKVSTELASLVEDCYYPKVSILYKDLLAITHSDEKTLRAYSKKKYGNPKWRLLHDPQTTLLILIVQEFIKQKDMAAALSAFHLFSLRNYSNLLHKYIRHCNPELFRSALQSLSHNHLFVTKQTIPSSIMYLSNTLFKKYQRALVEDDAGMMLKLIMEIRHRFEQSILSFAKKYYAIHKSQQQIKSEDEKDYDVGYETKLKQFIGSVTKDITIYKNVDKKAVDGARKIIKFNRKYSEQYAKTLTNPKYTSDINSALYLLMKDIKDFSKVPTTSFLDHVKKLMSVKVSKQPLYFKKVISKIHDQVIEDLELVDWFNKLSIQSKSISRNFIAYYLAVYVQNHIS